MRNCIDCIYKEYDGYQDMELTMAKCKIKEALNE